MKQHEAVEEITRILARHFVLLELFHFLADVGLSIIEKALDDVCIDLEELGQGATQHILFLIEQNKTAFLEAVNNDDEEKGFRRFKYLIFGEPTYHSVKIDSEK